MRRSISAETASFRFLKDTVIYSTSYIYIKSTVDAKRVSINDKIASVKNAPSRARGLFLPDIHRRVKSRIHREKRIAFSRTFAPSGLGRR